MASISLNAAFEEILGRYAGSIFQDSYFGVQARGFAMPGNPQTIRQQLRRGDFRQLTAGWRNLTPAEQSSWLMAAGTAPAALRLYIGSNINRILIGLDITPEFIPEAAPPGINLSISVLTNSRFLVSAAAPPTIVPPGCRLLLYATTDKPAQKIFTNPSEYSPIIFFNQGTDFSSQINVIDAWHDLYGQMRIGRRICIKSVVINESNGGRSEEFINCQSTAADIDFIIVSVTDSVTPPAYEFELQKSADTYTWSLYVYQTAFVPVSDPLPSDFPKSKYVGDFIFTTLTTVVDYTDGTLDPPPGTGYHCGWVAQIINTTTGEAKVAPMYDFHS